MSNVKGFLKFFYFWGDLWIQYGRISALGLFWLLSGFGGVTGKGFAVALAVFAGILA